MSNKITVQLSDIEHAALKTLLGTRSHSKGGLAKHGSNHENVLTTAAVDYSIDGVMYQLAITAEMDLSALTVLDQDTGATLTAVTAQATGYDRAYLLALTSGGSVRIIQGTAVAHGATVPCPACPPTLAPFGVIKVANATGSNFTLGTTALNTGSLTVTYSDVSLAPASV